MSDIGRPKGWISGISAKDSEHVTVTRLDWIPLDGIECIVSFGIRSYRFKKLHPGDKAILIAGWRRRKQYRAPYVGTFMPKYWIRDYYFRVYVPRLEHAYTLWLKETTPTSGTWEDYKKRQPVSQTS